MLEVLKNMKTICKIYRIRIYHAGVDDAKCFDFLLEHQYFANKFEEGH